MIQIFSNSLGDEELAAIKQVFDSKWLGKGPHCDSFEKELGEHFNSNQVLLTNCCTSAIYISLKALGIGSGDEVIISSANFVGVANAVVDSGATPIFADVDPKYFNILPSEIERLKTPKTKAVFILHYGGHPAPMDEIQAACGKDIFLLEDSANSVSSVYKGKSCGTIGAAGVFSFDAMKTLVMGDGGALIVKDSEAFTRAKAHRYLGFSQSTTSGAEAMKGGLKRWWEYELETTAGRYISNDIMASIGRIQLKKLPSFISKRKEIWARFQTALKAIPGLELPPEPLKDTSSSYYLYWVKVPGKRDALAGYLKDKGIYATFRYYPLHLVKRYGQNVKLRNSEDMNESTLNLPLHQNLTEQDINLIIDSVKSFFKS